MNGFIKLLSLNRQLCESALKDDVFVPKGLDDPFLFFSQLSQFCFNLIEVLLVIIHSPNSLSSSFLIAFLRVLCFFDTVSYFPCLVVQADHIVVSFVLVSVAFIPKLLKFSDVFPRLFQFLFNGPQFISVGADPKRTVLEVESLAGESLHLLHFLKLLHLLLDAGNLLLLILHLVFQVNAPQFLILVDQFLIQFYLSCNFLNLGVQSLHLLLEKVQSVFVSRFQCFLFLCRCFFLLRQYIRQSFRKRFDLCLQLFILMLILVQHLLKSKLLLVALLLIFILLVIITVLFVHLIYIGLALEAQNHW